MYKCLPACVYLYRMVTVAKEARRGHQIPCNWRTGARTGIPEVVSHGGVLGTKPQSSVEASAITC